jgi:hypothetical protein
MRPGGAAAARLPRRAPRETPRSAARCCTQSVPAIHCAGAGAGADLRRRFRPEVHPGSLAQLASGSKRPRRAVQKLQAEAACSQVQLGSGRSPSPLETALCQRFRAASACAAHRRAARRRSPGPQTRGGDPGPATKPARQRGRCLLGAALLPAAAPLLPQGLWESLRAESPPGHAGVAAALHTQGRAALPPPERRRPARSNAALSAGTLPATSRRRARRLSLACCWKSPLTETTASTSRR